MLEESSICILKPLKKRARILESAQTQMIAMVLGVGGSTNASLMRSVLCLPRMSFRFKWLRTSYCRRFISLRSTFFVRRCMAFPGSHVHLLAKSIFDDDLAREDLLMSELVEVSLQSAIATDHHFCPPAQRRPLSIFSTLDPDDARLLILWLLKKFPASVPPVCGCCNFHSCTQSHLAECTGLLRRELPSCAPRFRVEFALSFRSCPPSVIVQELRHRIPVALPHLCL